MRWNLPSILVLLAACFVLGGAALHAQSDAGAGDLFYKGYMLKTEAEKLEKEGNTQEAAAKYQQARQIIGTVAQNYPAWQPEVVNYRLRLIEQSLGRLSRQRPAAPSSPAPMGPAPSSAQSFAATPAPQFAPQVTPAAPADPMAEIANPLDIINQTFAAQQKQNAELKEKLRLYEDGYTNALREREKAQQESTLLNRQLQDITAKAEAMAKGANAKDANVQKEIQKIRDEAKMVQDMLASRSQQLMETGKAMESLQIEKDALQGERNKLADELAKAKRDSVKPEEFSKMLAENTRLKQELEVARVQVETLKTEGVKKDEEVSAMRMQIAGLQSEMAKLKQENVAYQGEVADLTVKLKQVNQELAMVPKEDRPTPEAAKLSEENKTLRTIIVRQLRQQQRQLQTKELILAEMKKMENTSQTLMENLEQLTSTKASLSAAEEALFSEPELKEIFATDNRLFATLQAPATSKTTPLPDTEEPASAALFGSSTEDSLLLQAAEALQKSDFKAAASAYQDVLRANPKNTFALTNLAGIRLQERKYDEAEVLLQKTLFYEPDNDAAHYRLGICYFQQDKLNEAQASFEKALAEQKDNARAHHYLGIITSKQGNRSRAETEFKSALAIDPNYADAHFNLAVLYATGTPPDWPLARKHYETALAQGIKADPALEKLLPAAGSGLLPTAKL
jgi:tetratricopeptide (TPR) repeat protein